ncbi:MLO-like protein 5 [Sesamum angolense]|uniref:MLO-like protein n=1 Tax=Sesamum angolense TaxID=2727404 RepID=A0AAE1WAY8_9LAMI|nr:MLO-like protein 5 [Sesamum angolense]
MAGGGSGSRELDRTPTWAVSLVCAVIILISIILEKTLHKVGETFHKRKKFSLVEALEKIKAELMILGFISLLLTFGQNYIAKICIPISFSNTMLPCDFKEHEFDHEHGGDHHGGDQGGGGHHRRLLWYDHRVLMDDPPGGCGPGKVPIVSLHGLHQLHIFIFFLAVFHVFYGAVTMMLGRLKIRGWKEWEKQIAEETAASNDPSRFRLTHETSFVRSHANEWMENRFIFYLVCFIRHMWYSVQKPDYLTLRHGFVSVHLSSGTKFDFQKYIKRSLEDDFKVVVGIPPYLWGVAVIYLLLNLKGGLFMFYLSIMPLVVILATGTKLQSIIAQMAIEIQEKHAVVQGIPLVQVSDRHFWFSKPTLVLYIIHMTLFQNAFEITYFMWIWYEFGLHSCFHSYFNLAIVRVVIGVIVQIVCSYITLPLYALVTQKLGGDGSEGGSPELSPHAHEAGQASIQMIDSRSPLSQTETANITAQVDIPPEEGNTKDLLTAIAYPEGGPAKDGVSTPTPKGLFIGEDSLVNKESFYSRALGL